MKSSNTTDTYTVKANEDGHSKGFQVYCVVTNSSGDSVQSEIATLTVASPITLTDPSDTTITHDNDAIFTVTATGTGDLTYQWEYLGPEYQWIAMPDTNSATLTINGSDAVNGTQYRCVVSDNYGQSKTSNAATLTVEAPANACGDNLTYTFENGVLTLVGDGEMWSYTDAESSPFNGLAITSLVIPDGVTVIGAHAFEGTTIQNSVVLPESVFSVRYKAFWGNDNLDITIENIGCAIYDKALPDIATVRGYMNSSAYHSSQGDDQTFINLDDESAFDAQTNKIVLTAGDTYQIEAEGNSLRYYSFNPDIVTVDSNGLVTAAAVDSNDRDAKVMVYDKAGRSTVYYFAVVDENTAPDYNWRYTIVSPSSWDQWIFVPFWGQRVSLNEDVAHIVDWDHASPTGTFGTAPIISADDRGNAYIFYYTYDADIRPIKAEESYTEETYEITEDWQNAFCKPYYSYTAEKDTRVYFKAYGSEDLDVAVYSEFGADPIITDNNGGRAEVSFDVKAGETVYIQPTAGQNQAFTYTMKLSTSAIETVSMTDNETYTIKPDAAGDLTTLSFTAPADGNYLIEGKSNAPFHYDLANNIDFTTNIEYDENGIELASPSTWSHETWSRDSSILPYYVWLNAGETVYIRGYFDNETTSDDSLSFRAHAVTPVDTALILNDLENPNVISLNPDNYDRRTIEGKAEAQYIISTDSTDNRAIVLDKDWNEVGLDYEWTETGMIYFFNCDEAQTYHVIVIPTQASENYGSVNVWVWENKDQEIDINLWDTYSFYNSRRAPVDYTFTAPMTGYYYLTSEYTGATSYVYTDEDGLAHEEIFDPTFSMFIYDNDYNTLHSFSLTPGMSEKESAFYLEEGQTVKINFYQNELRGSDHIDFSLNWAKPGVLDVDSTQENAIDENSCIWYEFTAPANGTYIFSAESNEGDMEFAFGSNGIEWISNNSSVEYSRELSKDETVYVRIYSSENDGLSYSISVSNSNNEFNPTVLESIAPELSDNAETHSYTVNEKEAYIKLEYTPEASSYVLSIQNVYNLESMAVWFLNANGEGECVGYTNSDGIFTWDMTNDFFGDDDYVFVKLVTEQNPLGYISVDYTYEVIDDIIPDEICEECGGVNGNHSENCSHYGEWIEDGDEDDSLIFDVTAWSDYNGGNYQSDETTNSYTGDSVSIELPVGFSGNFGAKYDGLDLEAGTYQLTFDLAVIGMADVEICVRDAEGNAVFEAMGDSGYDPVTNTFTFTIDEAIEGGSLTMLFYADSVNEGSIGASNVSVTNISLVELIPVGEDGSED